MTRDGSTPEPGWEEIADAVRRAERTRLADALHDDALPLLAVARQELLAGDEARGAAAIEQAIAALRSLIGAQHDESLSDVGVAEGIARIATNAVRRRPMRLVERLEAVDLLPADAELVLEVARELVANVVAHSEARTLEVGLRREGDQLLVEVVDDGIGFDGGPHGGPREGHLGLHRLRRRVEARAGRLAVDSAPGAGTRSQVALPLEHGRELVNVTRLLPDTHRLLESICDGWLLVRPDRSYLHASPGACRLFGRTRAALLDDPELRRPWWLDFDALVRLHRATLANGGAELVTVAVLPDGTHRRIELISNVMPGDGAGEPLVLSLLWGLDD